MLLASVFVNFKAELHRAEVESHYDEPLWTRRIQEKRARNVCKSISYVKDCLFILSPFFFDSFVSNKNFNA